MSNTVKDNVKIHLAVDAHGMPVRIFITEGTRADCKEAVHLMEGISAEVLLADRCVNANLKLKENAEEIL